MKLQSFGAWYKRSKNDILLNLHLINLQTYLAMYLLLIFIL